MTQSCEDPDLRDDFEHFDERLETWHFEGANYGGRNIGGGFRPSHFQGYDPDSGGGQFWDHAVSVPKVVNEATRILLIAEAAFLSRRQRP